MSRVQSGFGTIWFVFVRGDTSVSCAELVGWFKTLFGFAVLPVQRVVSRATSLLLRTPVSACTFALVVVVALAHSGAVLRAFRRGVGLFSSSV